MNAPVPAKHLQAHDSAAAEAIDATVRASLAPGAELDPLAARNFDEAIGNTLAEFGNDLAAKLAAALREGTPVNQILIDTSHAYWLSFATKRAEKDRADAVRQAAEDRAHAAWQAHHDARQAAYDRCPA